MTGQEMAILGMVGSATVAVFAGVSKVVQAVASFGRMLEKVDSVVRSVDEHDDKLDSIDAKVERHLQWHERDESRSVESAT